MKDKISIERINKLHPAVRGVFTKFIDDIETAFNITVRVVQGLRTFKEQADIYAQGRTKPGAKVTNAKPGQSLHNFGMAIDIVVIDGTKLNWDYDYKRFMQFMPKGMRWGGDWDGDGKTKADGDRDEHLVDYPHYEYTFGHGWKDLLAMHDAGKTADGYVIV